MNNTLIPIAKYLIEDAGPDHVQYWPGRSAHGTEYEEVVVGQGDDASEAFEDAIDQLRDLDYNVQAIPDKPDSVDFNAKLDKKQLDDGEFSYYVVIYVR